MHPRQPVPEQLRQLAQLQAGVVAREQVLGLGFGEAGIARMIREQVWVRLSRGIYLTGPTEPSWTALAWSGVLIGGDAARIGGSAAAHLHGLLPEPPATIEIWVPAAGSAPRVSGPWTFRRERPGARLASTVGSPPRLTIEDTVLDLIDDPDCDPRSAANWVTMAVQARRTTPTRIQRAAQARRFVRQRRMLMTLLDDVGAGVRSPIELDYLRTVERPHGLPVGRRQASRRNTEIDVYYDDFGLVVELDGRLGHTGLGRFRDMWRDNSATTDGLATLRYGRADVLASPCEVALQVAANLIRLGWLDGPVRCDHCRRVT